jgi:outer membrane immunogenic protein
MLKRVLLSALLSAVLFPALSVTTAAPASAQRYQDRQYRAYGWTGFYFGGSIGARYTDAKWTTEQTSDPFDILGVVNAEQPDSNQLGSRSFRGALHTGYNWHAGSWVWGVEGDLGFARSSKTVSGFPGTGIFAVPTDKLTAEVGHDGSLRLRAGVLLSPNTLWYVTGGLAAQEAQITAQCVRNPDGWCVAVARNETASKVLYGYTIGGGVETALTKNWLTRVEYRFSEFGKFDRTFFINGLPGDAISGTAQFNTHILNVGLSYKY